MVFIRVNKKKKLKSKACIMFLYQITSKFSFYLFFFFILRKFYFAWINTFLPHSKKNEHIFKFNK